MNTPRPPSAPAFGWQLLAPALGAALLLLLAGLWFAHVVVLQQARERDLARVQTLTELAKAAFAAADDDDPPEATLAKLRAAGLEDLQILPPDQAPTGPNPRYVTPGSYAEAWTYLDGPDGQPVGILHLTGMSDSARSTLSLIRQVAVASIVGTALILLITWLTVDQRVTRRLRGLAGELGVGGSAALDSDPVAALGTAWRAAQKSREEQMAARQDLLDHHTEMACRCSVEGHLLEVNSAYANFFGKTAEQLVGTNFLDLIPPADRADAIHSLRRLSPERPTNTVEHRVILAGGQIRWMRRRDRAVFDTSGKVGSVISFGLDITPEKQLATRIADLQTAFDQMQSMARTGSLTWNLTTNEMEWTDETYRLLGLSNGHHRPTIQTLLELVAPVDRPAVREAFEGARQQGDAFELEFRTMLPDGSLRVLQSRAEVSADPATKLLDQLTCTLRDITALRDVEAKVRRELRFREATEQAVAFGCVVLDQTGRILSVNRAFTAMSGWSQEELVNRLPPYPYWPEEERPAIEAAFATAISGNTPPEGFQLRFGRKDGSRFDVLVNVAPLLDERDQQIGWLGSVTDVTPLQETRRRLRETNERLETARDIAALGTWEWNPETGQIIWDERSFAIYGHPGATDAVAVWRSLRPLSETSRAEQNVLQAEAEGRDSGRFRIRIEDADGRDRYVESSFRRLRETGSTLPRFVGVHRDITAEVMREQELTAINERLQIAQQVAELGIWDWDPATDKLFWDPQSFALFGHPEATDSEEIWRLAVDEEQRQSLSYDIHRLIATGGTTGQDLIRARWPDGSWHDILSTYLVLRDDPGAALRVVGINRDITTEIEAERELRETQRRLAAALEGGSLGTFEQALDTGDLHWNQANYEIHGLAPSVTDPHELSRQWKGVVGDFADELMTTLGRLPVHQDTCTYEYTARPPGQKPRRVRCSVSVERSAQGHPARLIGVARRLD